jgi:VRR-NUC domain
MEPTEAEIQKSILEYLAYRGHFAIRINTQGVPMWSEGKTLRGFRKSPMVGVSDILGVAKGGQFFAIEVKKKGGKATEEQLKFIDNVKKRGGIGLIAFSIDEVKPLL